MGGALASAQTDSERQNQNGGFVLSFHNFVSLQKQTEDDLKGHFSVTFAEIHDSWRSELFARVSVSPDQTVNSGWRGFSNE